MTLEKVISGGQTGADRAALAAARAAGIATGGWMPRGFLAQDGTHPEFADLYDMQETPSARYQPRTARNVKDADATLRFARNWNSPGEVLTRAVCERQGKPYLEVTPGGNTTPGDVAAWLMTGGYQILNVAGNSEQTAPGIEDFVSGFLEEVFRLLRSGAA